MHGCHGFSDVGEPERWVFEAEIDLQPLDQVFDIHKGAGAELGIKCAGSHQVAHLFFAHGTHGGDVKKSAVIDILIPQYA